MSCACPASVERTVVTEQLFEECINRICSGDQSGLKEIYEAYLPYIFGIVHSMLRRREDAEDVTSAFFIRLWETAEKYRPGHGHRGYLAAIARNMTIDFIRKNRREIPMDLSGTSEIEENALYHSGEGFSRGGDPYAENTQYTAMRSGGDAAYGAAAGYAENETQGVYGDAAYGAAAGSGEEASLGITGETVYAAAAENTAAGADGEVPKTGAEKKPRTGRNMLNGPPGESGYSPGFEDRVVENMTLREALATLKPEEREIIHLKIAGGLTFQEISELLGSPMGTVTWRYREAIKKLRRYGYE